MTFKAAFLKAAGGFLYVLASLMLVVLTLLYLGIFLNSRSLLEASQMLVIITFLPVLLGILAYFIGTYVYATSADEVGKYWAQAIFLILLFVLLYIPSML